MQDETSKFGVIEFAEMTALFGEKIACEIVSVIEQHVGLQAESENGISPENRLTKALSAM